jgi:hypothetical protein
MLTIALGLLVAPLFIEAQPPSKVARIGVLTAFYSSRPPSDFEAAREGLPPLGYVELRPSAKGSATWRMR